MNVNDNQPITTPIIPIKARELPAEVLRKMGLREWLEGFALVMHQGREKRGGVVTPFLLGAISKLQWSAQHIKQLENDLHWLARDNRILRKQVEHLGGLPAPPFRPAAEDHFDPPLAQPPEHDPTNPFQHRGPVGPKEPA